MSDTQLDANAVREIAELARKSVATEVKQLNHIEELICHGNGYDRRLRPPPPRHHTLASIDDLVRSLEIHAAGERSSVWVSSRVVTVLYDDRDRVDFATWQLNPSHVFETLEHYNDRPLEPAAWLQLLRVDLDGAIEDGIAAQFSRLDWVKRNTTGHDIGAGKESLGKSITAEVEQRDELPANIVVQCPRWDQYGSYCCAHIRCLVTVNPINATIKFNVAGDQLAELEQVAVVSLREMIQAECDELEDVKVTVICGVA